MKADIEETYKKWWLNKYIRIRGQDCNFSLIKDIRWVGPPSGVYGVVEFTDEKGKTWVFGGRGFKPTKKEMEVLNEERFN